MSSICRLPRYPGRFGTGCKGGSLSRAADKRAAGIRGWAGWRRERAHGRRWEIEIGGRAVVGGYDVFSFSLSTNNVSCVFPALSRPAQHRPRRRYPLGGGGQAGDIAGCGKNKFRLCVTCFLFYITDLVVLFNFRSSSGKEPQREHWDSAGRDERRARNRGVKRDKR